MNSPSPTNFVYICISEDFGGHSECYLSPRGPVSELHKWNKWSGEKGWKGAHKYTKHKYIKHKYVLKKYKTKNSNATILQKPRYTCDQLKSRKHPNLRMETQ